jgi:hypothetical protein
MSFCDLLALLFKNFTFLLKCYEWHNPGARAHHEHGHSSVQIKVGVLDKDSSHVPNFHFVQECTHKAEPLLPLRTKRRETDRDG